MTIHVADIAGPALPLGVDLIKAIVGERNGTLLAQIWKGGSGGKAGTARKTLDEACKQCVVLVGAPGQMMQE